VFITWFPDSQQDAWVDPIKIEKDDKIEIQHRINSFQDIEILLCITAALKRIGCKDIGVFIPYLLGGRSDRQFKKGGTSYLKDIIAPIINSQNYSYVSVLDPHNEAVTDACINNLVVESNAVFIAHVIDQLSDYEIVCPDEGASKKIYSLLKQLHIDKIPIVCSKTRDVHGNITTTSVGNLVSMKGKKALIIDDICDGGRTFIEIAKKLSQLDCPEIVLAVTHGIFSSGFNTIKEYISTVHCTNSYSDIDNSIVKQYKVI
jgi:ribose-phosphate pyrophosphokinase